MDRECRWPDWSLGIIHMKHKQYIYIQSSLCIWKWMKGKRLKEKFKESVDTNKHETENRADCFKFSAKALIHLSSWFWSYFICTKIKRKNKDTKNERNYKHHWKKVSYSEKNNNNNNRETRTIEQPNLSIPHAYDLKGESLNMYSQWSQCLQNQTFNKNTSWAAVGFFFGVCVCVHFFPLSCGRLCSHIFAFLYLQFSRSSALTIFWFSPIV